jgi:asparagine synthase (glutamine-hydrolysing)
MDSSTVVALMAMESSKPVKTFSVGFEQNGFNELPYARKVAERFGTEHHEFVVRPSAAEVLPLLVRHYGEPFADSSAVPTYYVSQMARRHVTVALSGDGGDESFAGYQHYKQTGHWGGADFIPWAIRRRLARIAQGALDHMPYSNRTARVARGFQMIGSRLPERYLTQISIVKPQEKRACYTPYFRSLLNGSNGAGNLRGLPWTKSVDSLDWIMLHDQQFYLPDCLMVKTDVASMANSLEVRCPFLDHPFVEFAATIPSALKRNGTGGKVILKRAMRKLLPAEILDRGKTGFGMPLASWFRGELADMLKATLLDDIAAKRGLLNQSFLKRMVEEHISGKRDWSTRLWAFLFLELWFRELVD